MKVEPGARIAARWCRSGPKMVGGLMHHHLTAEVTIGGCVAMNMNDRNAWKCGPFGAYVLSLDVLLTTGESCTIVQEQDTQLFRAFVGSLGLLGIITSITIQLRRIPGFVTVRRRSAASLNALMNMFAEEEQGSDFMEAWLDGFAGGDQLGRGIITCATLINLVKRRPLRSPTSDMMTHLEKPLVSLAASLGRPVLMPAVQLANRANYWLGKQNPNNDWKAASTFPLYLLAFRSFCWISCDVSDRGLRHSKHSFLESMPRKFLSKCCATHNNRNACRFGVSSSSTNAIHFC